MGATEPAPERERPRIYHVSRGALPRGCVLRPYALGRESGDLLGMIARARAEGRDAVVALLAGERWRGLGSERGEACHLAVLEGLFEGVRRRVAPALPSRIEAVFGWESRELARRFRDAYVPGGTIHACTVRSGRSVTRDGGLVVAAYESVDWARLSVEAVDRLEAFAARYWLAEEPMAFPEILVHGTVVVDTIVDADGEVAEGAG